MRRGGDRRGSNTTRFVRRMWLLSTYGDGETAPCSFCEIDLDLGSVEADRIEHGGPYRRENVQPACRTCNAKNQHPGWEYDFWRECQYWEGVKLDGSACTTLLRV
jgi:hypothetical protein